MRKSKALKLYKEIRELECEEILYDEQLSKIIWLMEQCPANGPENIHFWNGCRLRTFVIKQAVSNIRCQISTITMELKLANYPIDGDTVHPEDLVKLK